MKKLKLTSENTAILHKKYTIGTSKMQASYTLKKGKGRVIVFLDNVNTDISDEELDKVLSKYELKIKD